MAQEKFALVAATPLQVMHCTEFVANDVDGSAGCSDLYIVHSFRTAAKVSEGVKKTGIFNNVYDLMPRTFRNGLHSKLSTFYDLFFPRSSLKNKSCGDKLALKDKDYEYVCASSSTTFTLGMHMAYPKAKVYMYDDGIGSYYCNMAEDSNSKLLQLMNRLFFRGKLVLDPVALFVSNPDLFKCTLNCECRKLPPISGAKEQVLESIFDYKANSLYRERKLIYLTQPFEEMTNVDAGKEAVVLGELAAYQDDALLRVHPRQREADFGCILRDTHENLWELECLKQITDRNVLLSHCSTAQFMPKLLNDTEPYIIFLYKIYGGEPGAGLMGLIREFTSLYRDPQRILIPETMDELREMLHGLMDADRA